MERSSNKHTKNKYIYRVGLVCLGEKDLEKLLKLLGEECANMDRMRNARKDEKTETTREGEGEEEEEKKIKLKFSSLSIHFFDIRKKKTKTETPHSL